MWKNYLLAIWGLAMPKVTSPMSLVGFASVLAFLVGGMLFLAFQLDLLPTDAGIAISGALGVFGLIGTVYYFVLWAPYQLWKRDAPLRDLAAKQRKTPGRFVWAYLSPVEPQANGKKALVRVSLVNALLFPLHLQQVKGVLVSDKGRVAEFMLLDVPEILHAGVSVPKSKVITLSEVTDGFPLNLPALDLVVDSQEGMVQIRGIYQSSPKNGE